jgi:hypothetical protein
MNKNAEVASADIDEEAALAAIDRCWNIEWQEDTKRLGSQVALMEEYLRRSAIAAEVLRTTLNWPWYDYGGRFARLVNRKTPLPCYVFLEAEPYYEGPGADPLEDKVIALNQHMNEGGGRQGWYGRKTCWWYIRWASIKSLPDVVSLELPDPYEPLLVFYERGGQFHPEQGILDLYGANVAHSQSGLRRRAEQAPLPTLDSAALDRLDTLEPYAWTKK